MFHWNISGRIDITDRRVVWDGENMCVCMCVFVGIYLDVSGSVHVYK